jgi:hypothetical protein
MEKPDKNRETPLSGRRQSIHMTKLPKLSQLSCAGIGTASLGSGRNVDFVKTTIAPRLFYRLMYHYTVVVHSGTT